MYEIREYQENETILREGELGQGFCILEEGVVEIIRDNMILNEISLKGAIFGELSEILMYKRSATVRAKTATKIKYFENKLETLVAENPKFAVKMIRNLGRRLYHMNNLAIEGNSKNDILVDATSDNENNDQDNATTILVVDEKHHIISQLSEIFLRNGWQIESASDESSAFKLCESKTFSAIIISISLPEDTAIELRRKLKTNPKAIKTPIIGMNVKGDEASLKKATDSGFSNFISKPIDANSVTSIMHKVLKLDPSDQYFEVKDDALYFKVPAVINKFMSDDIKESIEPRIRKTINEGLDKIIVDVSALDEIGEEAIEVVGEIGEKLVEMKVPIRGAFVARGDEAEMWTNLDGCEEWVVCKDSDEARQRLDAPQTNEG
jgi:CheY-like chemotaxis protein